MKVDKRNRFSKVVRNYPVLAVFTLLLGFSTFLLGAHTNAKELTSKPYKATTVDECIHEKACVLWAFERAVREPLYKNKEDAVIQKWNYPFNLFILGDEEDKYKDYIQEIFETVSPYVPFNMKVTNDGVVAVLLLSNDFDRDLNITYRDFYYRMFRNDIFLAVKSPRFANTTCLTIPFIDDAEIFSTALFIKNDKDRRQQCLDKRLFYSLGFLSGKYLFQQFPSDNFYKINDLHLFLIYLMYRPEIKIGMSIDDALIVIDGLHGTALNDFKEIEVE